MALQNLRTNTSHKRPTSVGLSDGQIAINTNSGSAGVFFKDADDNVVKVGPAHVGTSAPNSSPAAGGSTGNSIGEFWLDTTGGNYVLKIWDGSAWRDDLVSLATASNDGLLSQSDFTKLAGIASGAEVNVDTDLSYTAATRELASSTGDNVTLPLAVASGAAGLLAGADKTLIDNALQPTDSINALSDVDITTNAPTNGQVLEWDGTNFVPGDVTTAPVDSVNTQTGAVVLDADDIDDSSTTNKFTTAADITKLSGIAAGAEVNVDTDLSYTASTRVLASSTGDNVTLPVATQSAAGLISSTDKTKLDGIASGAEVNVDTNLSYTAATRVLASSTGTNATLPEATTSNAGLLSSADKTKLDGMDAGAEPNVGTDLTYTASTRVIASSTGDNATLPEATTSNAGLFSSSDKTKLNGIASGAEVNVQSNWTATSGDAFILNKPTIPTNNNQLTNGAGYITSADGGNAQTLDGINSTSFLRSDAADQKTSGTLRFNDNVLLTFGNSNDAELFCDGNHLYLDLNSGINNFFIRDGSSTRFTFDDAGLLGVGVSNPGQPLVVNTSVNTNINSVSGTSRGTLFLQLGSGGSTGNGQLAASIGFSRINTGRRGALIAGKQTTNDPDQLGLAFFTRSATNTASDAVAERVVIDHAGTLIVNNLSGSGNRAVYSTSNGSLTNSSSDATLKTNLSTLGNQLEVVKQLNPVTFNWIDTEARGEQQEIGFVAQELQPLVPQVIGTNYDETLSVDYSKLTAVLTKALQEAIERIETLEQRIEDAGL
tara:strand:+ start:7920 stop:10238 length:2319 start_codon:yes stop_codon:yes gene_type:complete